MESPPAFPMSTIDGFTQHGMDLRDWFAAHAMASLVLRGTLCGPEEKVAHAYAEAAYVQADALLAARAGK